MNYLCPVCGYNELKYPPKNEYICPCCGTQFGSDDFETSHDELRNLWIKAGAPWHSRRILPPAHWNPFLQLLKAGLNYQMEEDKKDTSTINTSVPHSRIPANIKITFASNSIIARSFVSSPFRFMLETITPTSSTTPTETKIHAA